MKTFALVLANVIIIYFLIGILFSLYFFIRGAAKIDPIIKDSKWTVRLLLLFGAMATWPLLIKKSFKS